jgi:hypothetical protein
MWDVFAVSTYFTVSVLFWYLGLVPDLATMRDRAKTQVAKVAYGVLSFGWNGGNRQWRHYEMAYLVLAGDGWLLLPDGVLRRLLWDQSV